MKLSVINPPDFTETFKRFADQAEADASWPTTDAPSLQANPVANVLDFDAQGHPSVDQGIVFDLNSVGITPGSSWTLRFKQVISTYVPNGTTSADETTIIISDSDQSFGGQAAQNWIGMVFTSASQISDRYAVTGFNSTTPRRTNVDGDMLHTPAVETLYWEIIRVNETLVVANLYSDRDYTKLLETHATIIANVTGLRYLKMTTRPNVVASGQYIGQVSDWEFWNDKVPRTPINNVPNYEDNFEIDKGWVPDGTLLNVNTIQNTIDWDSANLTVYDEVLTFDLGGAVSETFWTLRCKVTELVVNSSTAPAFQGGIGLSNNIANSSGGQDWIGSRYIFSNTQNLVTMSTANNVQIRANNFPVALLNAVGVVHFLEIRRLNSITCIMNIYADADFSQLIGTTGEIVIPAGITQLRFLKVWTRSAGTAGGEFSGTIEDIELFSDKGASKIQDWREVNG